MDTWAEEVRQWLANEFKRYWQDQYRAYTEGTPAQRELSLHQHRLNSIDGLPEIPVSIQQSYRFYHEHLAQRDCGSVSLSKLSVGDRPVWSVFARTDGDDGWLEVFDEAGHSLGAARTYIDLLCWTDTDQIRAQVITGELPAALRTQIDTTIWGKPQPS